MSGGGRPLICDFGIARIVPGTVSLSNTTTVRGSVRWMAPEFFKSENPVTEHSEATDVWGFGATLYVSFIFNVDWVCANICASSSNYLCVMYLTHISRMKVKLYTRSSNMKALEVPAECLNGRSGEAYYYPSVKNVGMIQKTDQACGT